jgi:H+/Cl- antiporter ClcA
MRATVGKRALDTRFGLLQTVQVAGDLRLVTRASSQRCVSAPDACYLAGAMKLLRTLLLRMAIGVIAGVLAGLGATVFLTVLDEVTETRVANSWLMWLLPVAAYGMGEAYHRFGGRATQGKNLIIEQIHQPTDWVPRRMGPMVLVATWITHLVGGSAGREGTALQLSGSMTDAVVRHLRIDAEERRLALQVAVAGGFGAVFGVPLAGAVFALEVPTRRRIALKPAVGALTASFVGHGVVTVLGYDHGHRSPIDVSLNSSLLGRLLVAGIAFGICTAAFAALSQFIRSQLQRFVSYPPFRQLLGGTTVLALALLFGNDYLGLSTPLADTALAGAGLALSVCVLKLVFTAATFGSGIPGGEVTPLFVMGATLGAALGDPLGVSVQLMAAVGFVSVFAGAAKTPVACAIMAAEYFGFALLLPAAIGCAVSVLVSGRWGIYRTQREPGDSTAIGAASTA